MKNQVNLEIVIIIKYSYKMKWNLQVPEYKY